ncbi:carbohydrate ABC transporter permease [Ruminiclostridium cellulolyticum]|uniref:Binding-protein-dependent transport systems inner membrane component n=1 Tax=Ruminiclostridium cellulolyticum (strain ATCC 35319 / DSM 5812 / JCM 6584 / H10) TaxID=394503 RepID=B8I9A1_RUMCH|nr:sugar ABC transporter permease [Ruminiclostridium cellulolyticum]ACL75361.1 binding-protein-dependent transport systems inner membrane component [Ruminiclostridium cellulolyticum H10]
MNKTYGNKLAIFIFSFPALLLFTVFVIYPLFPEILISFQKNDGFKSMGYVGFENYINVLKDSTFWRSNINTFTMVLISACIGLPLSLLLALIMDRQGERVKRFFKASSVFPAILSVTVIAQMWIAIYEPQWGLVNSILRGVGLGNFALEWLSNEQTVVLAITAAFLWQYIGLNALLFYTGIKAIPKTYYEAAVIDGAGFFRTSVKITIPLLQDVSKYVLVLSLLGCMSQFAHVRIMTAGGPGDVSRTVIYQLYYKAFSASDFGQGCAIAIIFVLECLVVTFFINKFVAREKIEF